MKSREFLNVKILYAEDEDDIRTLLASLLSNYVAEIRAVSNGQEAITLLEQEHFDMVITDINMPLVNGLELCEMAKNMFPNLPFIVTTAYSETDMLLKAIDLGVNQYVLKPVKKDRLLNAISKCLIEVENVRLKKELQEANEKEMELLKYRERYHTFQQENAFKKQIKITKDELSYLYENNYIFASYYKPLDILSGDSYGSINLGEGRYLFYLVDAMGKGLSASVTAIQSISFINNAFELSFIKDDFDLGRAVENFSSYIKKQLLDDEILSALFILLDTNKQEIEYSSFGMPPMLFQDIDKEPEYLECNNPPMYPFYSTLNTSKVQFKQLQKLLIYSDGLVENITNDQRLYGAYIKKDFEQSCSKNKFLSAIEKRISSFDDDTTFFYINRIEHDQASKKVLTSNTDLYELAAAVAELEEVLTEKIKDPSSRNKLFAAVNEVAMNALEHGNVGISYDEKQMMIRNGEFDNFIATECSKKEIYEKKITITLIETEYGSCNNIAIFFADEGEGFSTPKILKSIEIHRETLFCGRGIKLANQMSDGVFYNKKGNAALILFTYPKGDTDES